MGDLNEKTRIPIGWVFALLGGGASSLYVAFIIGSWVTGTSANAAALKERVDALEKALVALPKIEIRLSRIEDAKGIKREKKESLLEE